MPIPKRLFRKDMPELQMTLTTLQFPLDSLPNEVGSLFPLVQDGINSGQRPLGESRRHLFVIDLLASHGLIIGDITKCYKPHFCRYHLLTLPEYLISSKTSERETDMAKACTFLAIVDGASKWWDSFAIDRNDAIAQMVAIYGDAHIEVVCFRHV